MKSTVYRRGANGALVGTPEDRTAATQHPGRAATPPRPSKPARAPKLPKVTKVRTTTARPPGGPPPIDRSGRPQTLRPRTSLLRRLKQLVAVYVLAYIAIGAWTVQAIESVPAAAANPVADTRGTNWLLVGSDSRTGLTLKEQHQLHTGPDSGVQRSDVIIIVHIDGVGAATLVSLPRDSYVEIPEHVSIDDGTTVPARKNKLNAAFAFGGAPLLTATVEHNTGLHIDHFMQIGFAGIRDLTDAVGGVRICAPATYNDKNSGLRITKGCHHVNGKTALAYVRMRYADPTGDIGRIQRQQQYMAALMHEAAKPATLLNPLRVFALSRASTSSVIVGQGDGPLAAARLGMAMRGLSGGQGKVSTVPIGNPDGTSDVGSVVVWDKKAAAELFASLGAA